MTSNIDFNNPQNIQKHLARALPLYGLEGVKDRFSTGDTRGLGYMLVPRSMSARFIDITKTLQTVPADNPSLANYVCVARDYVKFSQNYAQKHGFKLLKFVESEELLLDDLPLSYAIGDTSIESLEKFERFLEMIKQGKVELDKQREIVEARAMDVTHAIFH